MASNAQKRRGRLAGCEAGLEAHVVTRAYGPAPPKGIARITMEATIMMPSL